MGANSQKGLELFLPPAARARQLSFRGFAHAVVKDWGGGHVAEAEFCGAAEFLNWWGRSLV